jgi:multiple RNA-binding domain-containing protein 1
MQPPTRSKTWADGGVGESANLRPTEKEPNKMVPITDHLEEVHSQKKKLRANDHSGVRSPLQTKVDAPLMEDTNARFQRRATAIEPSLEEATHPVSKSADHEITKTDEDWLLSRTSRLLGLVDDEDEAGLQTVPHLNDAEFQDGGASDADDVDPQTSNSQIQIKPENLRSRKDVSDVNIDMIRKTGRLFVRNLPYDASESDLEPLFSPFGMVDEVRTSLSLLLLFLC